jgi:hypothetical protein
MTYKVQFSQSVLQGIRDLANRSFGPDELAKTVLNAYGPNAIEMALQIATEIHGPSWFKETNSKPITSVANHIGSFAESPKVADDQIDPYMKLRGKFSFSELQGIRAMVKKSLGPAQLEKEIAEAYGKDAVPIARTIAAGKKVFEWQMQVKESNKTQCLEPPILDESLSARGKDIPPSFAWRLGHFFAYFWQFEFVKCVFWVGVICSLAIAAETYSKYRKAEDFKAERASIGSSATVAGAMWASAVRSCNAVGIPNVRDCANNTGLLTQDTTAKMIADIAVQRSDDYIVQCERHFSGQYCLDLVNRAFRISYNTRD